jgi:hypothetical protein
MATLADLQTKTDAAIAAFEAGNYKTAATLAQSAMLIIATTPDTQFDGGDQIRFDRVGATMALKEVIKACNAKRWAGGSNQPIEYRRG